MKKLFTFDQYITEMQSLKGGEEVRLNLQDGYLYDETGQIQVPEFNYNKQIGKQLSSNTLFASEDVNKWLENNEMSDIVCAGVLPFPK
jgi:hypothetical protein